MSHGYIPITWTPFKKKYDRWALGGIALYILLFVGTTVLSQPSGQSYSLVQALLRASGSLAFLMLTLILCIGPLARLNSRFIPLLYNRRHLGVMTFAIALVHAILVIFWYHSFGVLNPLVSLLVSNPRYDSIAGFPFEILGLAALTFMFLMAATSHDFWNSNLGPGLWKAIHMSVYLVYVLLVAHVMLGVLQFEKSPVYVALVIAAATAVCALHIISAITSRGKRTAQDADGWLRVAPASAFEEGKAKIVYPETGESIAVFLHDGAVSAVSNVCRHQGGPLGEGRIVDGCITCPWHGFQYRLEDGRAPPPFTEKIATYTTKVLAGYVLVQANANPAGTLEASSLLETSPP